MPVTSCQSFHDKLTQGGRDVSHMDGINGERAASMWYAVEDAYRPAAHCAHTVTLAMSHALALANDECHLEDKWATAT